MKDFRNLKVWEKAHYLTLKIYGITSSFPKEELYGLTSQIRRASSSIPTNIAEGCGRTNGADFARFLQIAMGSASELEYLVLLAHELKFIELLQQKELTTEITQIKKMLTSLMKKIRTES